MENENKYTPEGVGWNRFRELCEERGIAFTYLIIDHLLKQSAK